ncbi:stage II sporulation protein M [Candidatus Nanohalovita haloferacivicina]|uniref:stage II sporulation protein M n=1 Tax=Candidatus Nanohalovita haloferacivicina TaxID=2978046 RepID=UPI00325FCEE7|nr:Integral membrane protein [Candidatus Nanohalobia archaeon BNXNv]
MLPELILREEKQGSLKYVTLLGLLSGLTGYGIAKFIFPGQTDVLSVVFASIPLVFPLTKVFLEDEENGRPHTDEVEFYGTLFLGQFIAFLTLGLLRPEDFSMQTAVFSEQMTQLGLTGNAILPDVFFVVISNNLVLYLSIFAVAAVIGSAGAFILTWNASALGIFMAHLIAELRGFSEILLGAGKTPSPVAYVPHATLEMAGFAVAGICGSLVSAAVYREHFDTDTWKDLTKLFVGGLLLILVAALLESA